MSATTDRPRVTVTKLSCESGYWTGRVTVSGGETIEVTRRHGSWGTQPDDRGAWREVLPWLAMELQTRVRPLDRRSKTSSETPNDPGA